LFFYNKIFIVSVCDGLKKDEGFYRVYLHGFLLVDTLCKLPLDCFSPAVFFVAPIEKGGLNMPAARMSSIA
jgi:hypothetical protein